MAARRASDPGGRRPMRLEKLVGGPVAAALFERRREYLRRDTCTIKVTTWNVAAADGTDKDIAAVLHGESPHHPSSSSTHQSAQVAAEGDEDEDEDEDGHGHGSRFATDVRALEQEVGYIPYDAESTEQEGQKTEGKEHGYGRQAESDLNGPGKSGEGDKANVQEKAVFSTPRSQRKDKVKHYGGGVEGEEEILRENLRTSDRAKSRKVDEQGSKEAEVHSIDGAQHDDAEERGKEETRRETRREAKVGRAASSRSEKSSGGKGKEEFSLGTEEVNKSPADFEREKSQVTQNILLNCIHVICLQEVVDVTAPENFIRSGDGAVQKRWQDAIQAALPEYRCLLAQQLVGILMFVYVSPDIASQVTSPCVTSVGTGLMGYMGNKGGVLSRVVIGGLPAAGVSPPSYADSEYEEKESEEDRGVTIVFVSSHLAAFAHQVDRRNWDYAEILRRAFFRPKPLPISGGGTVPDAVASSHPNGYGFHECDLIIWAGDLNYRLDMSGNQVRRSLHKFLPPEIDGSDAILKLNQEEHTPEDPEEAQWKESHRNFEETIEHIMESDQLRKQQSQGKSFQNYHEGKITFMPTYKYDLGTVSTFDTSEKARVPSYCDRVLWKDRKVEIEELERIEERKKADARDKKREALMDGTENTDILFEFTQADEDGDEPQTPKLFDPNTLIIPNPKDHEITSINDIDISDVVTPLKLLKYVSNQAIVSSDHKPVSAEFDLRYMSVDQEKRSVVQVEIVKELDRLENEIRPAVTVIVDGDSNSEFVDFGEVAWDQIIHRTVTIANTGRSPAICEFVKRPVLPNIIDDEEDSGFTKVSVDDPMAFGDSSSSGDGEEICKPWLSATFNSSQTEGPHTLQPGDAEAVTIRLALPPQKRGRTFRASDASLLRNLNTKREELADVLVLRVAHGQEKFIPVKAEFLPTFLGYGLTDLLKVPDSAGGVRNNPKCDGNANWSAPRELFRMTEYLLLTLKSIVMSEGGEGVRWTMLPGWPFVRDTWGLTDRDGEDGDGTDELSVNSTYARSALKRWIRDALDCDRDWRWEEVDKKGFSEEDKCEVMAECLFDWLVYLKDGVLPASLYGEVVKGVGGNSKAGADKILDMLPTAAPPVHANVFVYLTGFIAEIISLLSPKYDPAVINNFTSPPLSPVALVKRLSGSSRATTTELVKKNLMKEFADVIVRRPPVMDGWRSETLERREEERRIAFLGAFVY
ncbi:Synaptojanin-1 [Arthrobotrys entomopaga]|nr:Synaptojanin-1 [Arthrobotrys entomopaga]